MQQVLTVISIDVELWNALKERCDELGIDPADYFEDFFRYQLKQPKQDERRHQRVLRRIELAATYAYLIETYGEDAVRETHDRFVRLKRK